jgi:hypothetical protein
MDGPNSACAGSDLQGCTSPSPPSPPSPFFLYLSQARAHEMNQMMDVHTRRCDLAAHLMTPQHLLHAHERCRDARHKHGV